MTRNIVFILILTLSSLALEITPLGGFQFNGENNFTWTEYQIFRNGKLDLSSSANCGVFVNIKFNPNTPQLELHWTSNKSTADWTTNSFQHKSRKFTVFTNYWHVGVLNFFQPQDLPFSPYVNTSIGTTLLSAKDRIIQPRWFLSVSGGAGIKIKMTERIGIRLGGRLLIPFNLSGTGISFDDSEISLAPFDNIPFLQGDMHCGVVIAIGKGNRITMNSIRALEE